MLQPYSQVVGSKHIGVGRTVSIVQNVERFVSRILKEFNVKDITLSNGYSRRGGREGGVKSGRKGSRTCKKKFDGVSVKDWKARDWYVLFAKRSIHTSGGCNRTRLQGVDGGGRCVGCVDLKGSRSQSR